MRDASDALALWRKRAVAQRALGAMRRRASSRSAVITLRAWRLAALVSAVSTCLRARRAIRRWARRAAAASDARARLAEEGVAAIARGLAEEASGSETSDEWFERGASRGGGSGFRRTRGSPALDHDRRMALEEYADAVLAAARPRVERTARRATPRRQASAWHLRVRRAQHTRLETLVQTCDALGDAAAKAAEQAAEVEARCASLETAASDASRNIEEARAAAAVAADEAKVLRVRVDGEAKATAGAEAVAAANAGEAASWRASAEEGKRVVEETARLFEAWALDLERDRAGFGDAVGLSTGKKRTSKKTATGSRRKGASRHERDTPAPPFGASRHERDALHERDTLHERDVRAPPSASPGDGSRDGTRDGRRIARRRRRDAEDAADSDGHPGCLSRVRSRGGGASSARRADRAPSVTRVPPRVGVDERASRRRRRRAEATRGGGARGASRACRETRARVEAEMEAARTAVREEVEAEEAAWEAEAAEAEAEEAEEAEEAKKEAAEAAEAATKVQRENRGRLASRASDAVTASRRSTPKKSPQNRPKNRRGGRERRRARRRARGRIRTAPRSVCCAKVRTNRRARRRRRRPVETAVVHHLRLAVLAPAAGSVTSGGERERERERERAASSSSPSSSRGTELEPGFSI